jgi:hypothetical protein
MKILNGSYAIDKTRAYFNGIPIEGVDVKTFRAIDESSAKDCHREYLLERPKADFYINGTPLKSPPYRKDTALKKLSMELTKIETRTGHAN